MWRRCSAAEWRGACAPLSIASGWSIGRVAVTHRGCCRPRSLIRTASSSHRAPQQRQHTIIPDTTLVHPLDVGALASCVRRDGSTRTIEVIERKEGRDASGDGGSGAWSYYVRFQDMRYRRLGDWVKASQLSPHVAPPPRQHPPSSSRAARAATFWARAHGGQRPAQHAKLPRSA